MTPESKSVKMMRKAALNFYLNTCLNLKLNFKFYSTRSTRQNIRPHTAFDRTEVDELLSMAKADDVEMYALVR